MISNEIHNRMTKYLDALFKKKNHPNRMMSKRFCHTCFIIRPPLASHCETCDHCVRSFDHHCLYVNNCIGERNYWLFVVMSTLSVFMSAIFICSTFIYISSVGDIKGVDPDQVWRLQRNLFGVVMFLLTLYCKMDAMLLISMIYAIWVFLNVVVFCRTFGTTI